jgi:hypothetical protein
MLRQKSFQAFYRIADKTFTGSTGGPLPLREGISFCRKWLEKRENGDEVNVRTSIRYLIQRKGE